MGKIDILPWVPLLLLLSSHVCIKLLGDNKRSFRIYNYFGERFSGDFLKGITVRQILLSKPLTLVKYNLYQLVHRYLPSVLLNIV